MEYKSGQNKNQALVPLDKEKDIVHVLNIILSEFFSSWV